MQYQKRHSYLTSITIWNIELNIILSVLYISINFEYASYFDDICFLYSIVLNFWLTHYDIEIEYVTANQEWKSLGNMEEEMSSDWFLAHKNKWVIGDFYVPFLIILTISDEIIWLVIYFLLFLFLPLCIFLYWCAVFVFLT